MKIHDAFIIPIIVKIEVSKSGIWDCKDGGRIIISIWFYILKLTFMWKPFISVPTLMKSLEGEDEIVLNLGIWELRNLVVQGKDRGW